MGVLEFFGSIFSVYTVFYYFGGFCYYYFLFKVFVMVVFVRERRI